MEIILLVMLLFLKIIFSLLRQMYEQVYFVCKISPKVYCII